MSSPPRRARSSATSPGPAIAAGASPRCEGQDSTSTSSSPIRSTAAA
ncbi:hypothetical protein [Nannocystis pusilla]